MIGIIGGSGLNRMTGFSKVKEIELETPFGKPSAPYVQGSLGGVDAVFLPRHGKGHTLLPSEINFRANIFGFKLLGVDEIISASAVGSLKEEYKPLDIVIPDQFFDRTYRRTPTFFGRGAVAHVPMADPICPRLADALYRAAVDTGASVHRGGTYICIEGPQFSTRAESELYRSWGMDVIGMTNLQEAKLAREAEICYTTMALVTDYDCWHEEEADVTTEAVLEILRKNAETAKEVIRKTVEILAAEPRGDCFCGTVLDDAFISDIATLPEDLYKELEPILRRVSAGRRNSG